MNVFTVVAISMLVLTSALVSSEEGPKVTPIVTPTITPMYVKPVRNSVINAPESDRCLPATAGLEEYCSQRLFECACIRQEHMDAASGNYSGGSISQALSGYCNLAPAEEAELKDEVCVGDHTLCADEFLARLQAEVTVVEDINWVDGCLDGIYEEDDENQTKKRDLYRI